MDFVLYFIHQCHLMLIENHLYDTHSYFQKMKKLCVVRSIFFLFHSQKKTLIFMNDHSPCVLNLSLQLTFEAENGDSISCSKVHEENHLRALYFSFNELFSTVMKQDYLLLAHIFSPFERRYYIVNFSTCSSYQVTMNPKNKGIAPHLWKENHNPEAFEV